VSRCLLTVSSSRDIAAAAEAREEGMLAEVR
jgi:hypothetical protein